LCPFLESEWRLQQPLANSPPGEEEDPRKGRGRKEGREGGREEGKQEGRKEGQK
jgi:hypothetical protein